MKMYGKHAASFVLRHQDVVLCAHQHQNSWGAPGARHGWQLGRQHPERVSHLHFNAPTFFTPCIFLTNKRLLIFPGMSTYAGAR